MESNVHPYKNFRKNPCFLTYSGPYLIYKIGGFMKYAKLKSIKGHLYRYWVSEYGNVFDLWRLRKLPFNDINAYGTEYKSVDIRNGNSAEYLAHRLVLNSFVGYAPIGTNIVNHIDGCKTNNHIKNLEWCSSAENLKHARETGLCARKKYEKVLDKITEDGLQIGVITDDLLIYNEKGRSKGVN